MLTCHSGGPKYNYEPENKYYMSSLRSCTEMFACSHQVGGDIDSWSHFVPSHESSIVALLVIKTAVRVRCMKWIFMASDRMMYCQCLQSVSYGRFRGSMLVPLLQVQKSYMITFIKDSEGTCARVLKQGFKKIGSRYLLKTNKTSLPDSSKFISI